MRFRKLTLFAFIISNTILLRALYSQSGIPTPEEFVGFKVGADKHLFGWNKVVDYFNRLDEESDRVLVQKIGESTQENPFIMAIISSPTNLMNIVKYKNLQKQAANPRHFSDEDAKELARRNKLVVMIILNSNDIASGQGSIELAYTLATKKTPEIKKILGNTIILLVPSMNPDGMQRIVWWYNQFLNSPYEASRTPYLSHSYAGQENSSDWMMMNLVETKLLTEQIYKNWFPQVIYIQEQKEPSGARMVLSTRNNAGKFSSHPLVHSQTKKLNQHITAQLGKQNLRGVVTQPVPSDPYANLLDPFQGHNMLPVVSRIAEAQLATPLYFPTGSLKNTNQGFLDSEMHPWPGGWWRLRDIIDYEMATIFSLLEFTAREKKSILYNFCKMNMDAIAKGNKEKPFAFIVPRRQHDPITTLQMLNVLMQAGVEIHSANDGFTVANQEFNEGDFVILLAQPFQPYVKRLLQKYPGSKKTNGASNHSEAACSTLPLLMGVKTIQIDEPFDADLTKLKAVPLPRPKLDQEKGHYLISHKVNRSFNLVNHLLAERKKVFWLKRAQEIDGQHFDAGTIYVPNKEMKLPDMQDLAKQFSLEIQQTRESFKGKVVYRLKPVKLGLYQPWTANIDEGWTRLILEKFEFPYKTIHNAKMIKSNLKGDFDAIILPDMSSQQIIHGRHFMKPDIYTPRVPKAYQNGIGTKGVENLKDFVLKGGTLITLDSSCDLVIEQFGLPVENVLRNEKSSNFSCQGSLLELVINNTEPIAFGMPQKTAAVIAGSPAFLPFHWTKRTGVIASYPEHNPLLIGSISGYDKIRGLAATLEIPMGKGRVVLLGFRVQHRAQAHATLKLLFNAIHLARAQEVVLKK